MTDLEQEVINLTREAGALSDEALLDAFAHESCYDACLDTQERSLRFHVLRKEALRRMVRGKKGKE